MDNHFQSDIDEHGHQEIPPGSDDSALVDRVALALLNVWRRYHGLPTRPSLDHTDDEARSYFRAEAVAALAAMRQTPS